MPEPTVAFKQQTLITKLVISKFILNGGSRNKFYPKVIRNNSNISQGIKDNKIDYNNKVKSSLDSTNFSDNPE